MNDMLTDDISDRDVIARLRSALEEVAAAEPVVIETADRRHPAAWLAVAAASVALVGGAGWALTQRDEVTSIDPAASSPTTIDGTPTTAVPETIPWFSVASPDLVPGRIRRAPVSDDRSTQFQAWQINGGGLDGLLFVSVLADEPDGPPDTGEGVTLEPLTDVAVGQAWLVFPPSNPDQFVSPSVYWSRGDGIVWVFEQVGLYSAVSTNVWLDDMVLAAQPGSGIPVVLPDERVTLLSVGPGPTVAVTQTYSATSGGAVELRVDDSGTLSTLSQAVDVRPVSIAGAPGWAGTFPDGHVAVVWNAGSGWWGSMSISTELADRADGIIAAVALADDATASSVLDAPSATNAPSAEATENGAAADVLPPDQQYYVEALLVDDGAGGIVARVPVDGTPTTDVPLRSLTWDAVDDERPVDGVLQAGPFLLTVTWDGTSFTPVFIGTSVPPAHAGPACEPVGSALDATMARLTELEPPSYGIAYYGLPTNGDCSRVLVDAWVNTPELRAALTPIADTVDVRILLTPVPGD